MEIIYRIYQVNRQFNESDDLLNQEVMITESRETFKDNMRLLYPNIKFANSKKLKDGDVYCIIISDNCYNAEKYITVLDYKCSHCNKTFKSNEKLLIKFGSYFNSISLFDNKIDKSVVNDYIDKIKAMVFCSKNCMEEHKQNIIEDLRYETLKKHNFDKDFAPDTFIDNFTFTNHYGNNILGFIYKITKKSTKEFYIGQTKLAPIFRWGQHLLTDRFSATKIDDFIFEVLEIVKLSDIDIIDKKKKKNSNLLNERERFYIHKYYVENPQLCLNVIIPLNNNN